MSKWILQLCAVLTVSAAVYVAQDAVRWARRERRTDPLVFGGLVVLVLLLCASAFLLVKP